MKKETIGYVDGFVLIVAKDKLNAYKKMAKQGENVWMKHGALDYKECVGDDMHPEGVKFPFPKMTKVKDDEVIIFSYIGYKNKTHRNQVNKLVMNEFASDKKYHSDDNMPFDMKRMAFGGFKVIVG